MDQHPLKTCRFCSSYDKDITRCREGRLEPLNVECPSWRQEYETGDICILKGMFHDVVVIVTWASREQIAYRYLDAPNGAAYGLTDRRLPDECYKPNLINTMQKSPMPTVTIDLDEVDKQRAVYIPEPKTRTVKAKDPLSDITGDTLKAFNILLDSILKGAQSE